MSTAIRPSSPRVGSVWPLAVRAGAWASVLSATVLLGHGRWRLHSQWALINAPSQWVHGSKALHQRRVSWRYSALGALIHHVSSLWWAWVFAHLLNEWRARPTARVAPCLAVGVTALAWWVDTRLVPRRLAPGFDRLAGRWGLACVYGAFAAGLARGASPPRPRRTG